jgi:hypothetical protein
LEQQIYEISLVEVEVQAGSLVMYLDFGIFEMNKIVLPVIL